MNGVDRFSLGGEQPKLIVFTGSEQTLPSKCIGFKPNANGCIISSLKDDKGIEYATDYGFASVDLKDKQQTWFIKGGTGSNPAQFLSKVTGTAGGSIWVYTA